MKRSYDKMFRNKLKGVDVVVSDNTNYEVEGLWKPGGIMLARSKCVKGWGVPEVDSLGRWVKAAIVQHEI